MLVEISPDVAVNPADVSAVCVETATKFVVHMISGAKYVGGIQHGETAWNAADRVREAIRVARRGG